MVGNAKTNEIGPSNPDEHGACLFSSDYYQARTKMLQPLCTVHGIEIDLKGHVATIAARMDV